MLPYTHEVKQCLINQATNWMLRLNKMRDLYPERTLGGMEATDADSYVQSESAINHMIGNTDYSATTNWNMDKGNINNEKQDTICRTSIQRIYTENGTVELRMEVDDCFYYDFLTEITGTSITSEYQMIAMIKNLSEKKSAYEKVENAIASVTSIGYGVVAPELNDISMEEPVLITHSGKYGVKIRANSPSIHMIKANIETEIAPIVGNKEQAEDLIAYIKDGECSEEGIWGANIFGKSLGELMEDGIRHKIEKMDEECQQQLQNTMQKIVTDANGGMVCIII